MPAINDEFLSKPQNPNAKTLYSHFSKVDQLGNQGDNVAAALAYQKMEPVFQQKQVNLSNQMMKTAKKNKNEKKKGE